jgi:adenosylhomocysteine nucleosidase
MIVAIAAEEREFTGLLQHAVRREPVPLPLRFACRASIGGEPWLLAAHGPGPALAAFATEAALGVEPHPRALLSTGLCGGLQPHLRAGDVLIGAGVRAESGAWTCAQPKSDRGAAAGVVWSQDRVAWCAAEKRALQQQGADAVEMEAAAVAHSALRHSLPFFCIRVVSDALADDMPFDFNQYRDAEGRFNIGAIGRAALRRPAAIPALIGLARRSARAGRNLGDFLADCQFPV